MSALSTLVFLATVLGVALLWLRAIALARGLAAAPRAAVAIGGLVMGLLIPGVSAAAGWLDSYEPPPPGVLVVAAAAATTLAIGLSRVGLAIVEGSRLPWLVGFQAFRIPVEWWLHRAFEEGMIPVQMTYAGLNFDVITGITAAVLAGWLIVAPVPRVAILLWNLLGLGLLLNIIVVSVLSTPLPIRAFTDGPPNLLPSTFPYIWLPTFLVQAALLGHILVFRTWRRYR